MMIYHEAEEILHVGQPWGGLHERLTGRQLARGLHFNVSTTPETQPWLELLDAGTFSAETLKRTPTSFQVDALWISKLKESAVKHGWTWLHHVFVGTAELEIGNTADAMDHFTKSMAMQPSVHAARGLAVFVDASNASHFFDEAWKAWNAVDTADSAKFRLGADLAKEYSSWLVAKAQATGDWQPLMVFVKSVETECGSFCMEQDLVLLARANLELHFKKDPHACIATIRSQCFPTFSNQRGDVNAVWWAANLAIESARLGHPLSKMETVRLRRNLGCDGEDASTHVAAKAPLKDTCVVGPPNIGYPY